MHRFLPPVRSPEIRKNVRGQRVRAAGYQRKGSVAWGGRCWPVGRNSGLVRVISLAGGGVAVVAERRRKNEQPHAEAPRRNDPRARTPLFPFATLATLRLCVRLFWFFNDFFTPSQLLRADWLAAHKGVEGTRGNKVPHNEDRIENHKGEKKKLEERKQAGDGSICLLRGLCDLVPASGTGAWRVTPKNLIRVMHCLDLFGSSVAYKMEYVRVAGRGGRGARRRGRARPVGSYEEVGRSTSMLILGKSHEHFYDQVLTLHVRVTAAPCPADLPERRILDPSEQIYRMPGRIELLLACWPTFKVCRFALLPSDDPGVGVRRSTLPL